MNKEPRKIGKGPIWGVCLTKGISKDAADELIRGIKRKTRKHCSAEEKNRIVLAGLRSDESIAAP